MDKFIESALARNEIAREDDTFEIPLRPQILSDFIGQEHIRERLDVIIGAAIKRKETLGHCLFSGPPGLGKTTLANIIAKAMGTNLVVTSGPALEKKGDLAGILTKLQPGDVLFIDEIHRLDRAVEEYLYPAIEDFQLDLVIDSGPNARSVQVPLKPFTLVAATTRTGLLSAPLRTRFAFHSRLDYYKTDTLRDIVLRAGRILNVPVDPDGASEIACRARGTPRIANNLLRWVRDYAAMRGFETVNQICASKALEMLSIDEKGLDEMDLKILKVLIEHYQGGPVGLNTLAVAIGEESHTIEEVYEPFLIMQGFIKRTPRGREATPLAYEHLEKTNF